MSRLPRPCSERSRRASRRVESPAGRGGPTAHGAPAGRDRGGLVEQHQLGLLTSARAIVSRRFIPPESESTLESRRSASCTNRVACPFVADYLAREAEEAPVHEQVLRDVELEVEVVLLRDDSEALADRRPVLPRSNRARAASPCSAATALIMRIVELCLHRSALVVPGIASPRSTAKSMLPDGDEVAVALGEVVRLIAVRPLRRDASSAWAALPSRPVAWPRWRSRVARWRTATAACMPAMLPRAQACTPRSRRSWRSRAAGLDRCIRRPSWPVCTATPSAGPCRCAWRGARLGATLVVATEAVFHAYARGAVDYAP